MNAVAIIEDRPSMALELPEEFTFEQWIDVGERLRESARSTSIKIGLWRNAGVEKFGEEWVDQRVQEIWGVEAESARVYGWAVSKFQHLDVVNRLTRVTVTHLMEVASLPTEQAVPLLERADREGLSRRDLRAEVVRIRGPRPELPRYSRDPIEEGTQKIIDAWNAADVRSRKDFIERQRPAGLDEVENGESLIDAQPLPIEAFDKPATLSMVTGGPLRVCRLLFAAAGGDPNVAQIVRSDAKDEETNKLRRAVVLVAKLHTEATLPEIGKVVGRDHSSVRRSLDKAKLMWVRDDEFRALCGRMTMEIAPLCP